MGIEQIVSFDAARSVAMTPNRQPPYPRLDTSFVKPMLIALRRLNQDVYGVPLVTMFSTAQIHQAWRGRNVGHAGYDVGLQVIEGEYPPFDEEKRILFKQGHDSPYYEFWEGGSHRSPETRAVIAANLATALFAVGVIPQKLQYYTGIFDGQLQPTDRDFWPLFGEVIEWHRTMPPSEALLLEEAGHFLQQAILMHAEGKIHALLHASRLIRDDGEREPINVLRLLAEGSARLLELDHRYPSLEHVDENGAFSVRTDHRGDRFKVIIAHDYNPEEREAPSLPEIGLEIDGEVVPLVGIKDSIRSGIFFEGSSRLNFTPGRHAVSYLLTAGRKNVMQRMLRYTVKQVQAR